MGFWPGRAGWGRAGCAPRGSHPGDHHLRVIRRAALTIGAIRPIEAVQVHLLHRAEHRPDQMILRQPIRKRRRQQKRLTTVTRDEVLSHPDMVLNHPDDTRKADSLSWKRVCCDGLPDAQYLFGVLAGAPQASRARGGGSVDANLIAAGPGVQRLSRCRVSRLIALGAADSRRALAPRGGRWVRRAVCSRPRRARWPRGKTGLRLPAWTRRGAAT